MKWDVYEDTNITNVYFSSYINTKDFPNTDAIKCS